MNKIVDTLNGLPLILKIILCLPALDIVWGVARICKGVADKNLLYTILGILTVVPCAAFIWVIDLILVIVRGKALFM